MGFQDKSMWELISDNASFLLSRTNLMIINKYSPFPFILIVVIWAWSPDFSYHYFCSSNPSHFWPTLSSSKITKFQLSTSCALFNHLCTLSNKSKWFPFILSIFTTPNLYVFILNSTFRVCPITSSSLYATFKKHNSASLMTIQ